MPSSKGVPGRVFLLLGVLVNVHAGGPCGGPRLAVVRWYGSPLASSLGVLVLVLAGRGVGRGGGWSPSSS